MIPLVALSPAALVACGWQLPDPAVALGAAPRGQLIAQTVGWARALQMPQPGGIFRVGVGEVVSVWSAPLSSDV